jgi:hypothetical protein
VRVEYQRQRCALSDETVQILKDAGQAASDQVLAEWIAGAQEIIKPQKKRLANIGKNFVFSFPIPVLQVSEIDRHPNWMQALKKVNDSINSIPDPRHEARRADDAMTIVGFLDKELWLRKEQRDPLKKLVYDVIPEGGVSPRSDNPVVDVSMLLLPLLEVAEADLTFLTAQQLAVWKGLKQFFDCTPRPARLINPGTDYSLPTELLR